jgi:hypothetical protein
MESGEISEIPRVHKATTEPTTVNTKTEPVTSPSFKAREKRNHMRAKGTRNIEVTSVDTTKKSASPDDQDSDDSAVDMDTTVVNRLYVDMVSSKLSSSMNIVDACSAETTSAKPFVDTVMLHNTGTSSESMHDPTQVNHVQANRDTMSCYTKLLPAKTSLMTRLYLN